MPVIAAEPVDESPQTFLEGHFRGELNRLLDACEIRARFEHVPGLRREQFDRGLAAQEFFEQSFGEPAPKGETRRFNA